MPLPQKDGVIRVNTYPFPFPFHFHFPFISLTTFRFASYHQQEMKKIYLDHIAATPLLPEAMAAMLPFLGEFFHNPQSRYEEGSLCKQAVSTARQTIANLICADAREIIFTASGSEANNLAIKGVVSAYQNKGRHIITSAIEHFSVAHPIKRLEREGWEVTWLPVDSYGCVDPDALAAAIRKETVLVSIMRANNEIGSLQPMKEISAITQKAGVLLHTDAVATVGVIPFDVDALGVDLASFSAQSFYGPKGVGALYLRRGTRILPLIEGGVQEEGRRAGTENVAAIVGMGTAAKEILKLDLRHQAGQLTLLRDRLIEGLLQRVPLLHLTGAPKARLPHIASFAVEYVDGEALVRTLYRRGMIAASGSSCSSHALKISPVLISLGLPANIAQGGIVMSLGKDTTMDEIETARKIFPDAVRELRELSPIYAGMAQGQS